MHGKPNAARPSATAARDGGARDRREHRDRRDRRGRGMRGRLAPPQVPISRTRSEVFDDLVLDAVEELESHWASELAGVQFAVEDVPPQETAEFDPSVVTDRGVALGRLYRDGAPGVPGRLVVLYRRPIETRAGQLEDRGELVFMVVAELVAELIGRDVDELGDE